MADMFGDPSLFEEFEKEREPDSLLLSKIRSTKAKLNSKPKPDTRSNERNENPTDSADFTVGNPAPSDSDGEYTETETSGINGTDIGRRLGGANTDEVNELQRQIELLSAENAVLKKQLRVIATQKYISAECSPTVQVLFMNHRVSRVYRAEVEAYIQSLIKRERDQTHSDLPTLSNKGSAIYTGCLDESPDEAIHNNSPHIIIGSSQMYLEYNIDTLGWPLVAYNPSLTDGWELPVYPQQFKEPMPAEEEDILKCPPKKQRQKASCFNCGGEHILSKCTLPKDMSKISKNRSEFMANAGPPTHSPQSRYHAGDDPRFNKFKPGIISDELRKALGMGPQQLPSFIYQMRRLGYPPGHLEDAKSQTSGMAMFDKHGKETDMEGGSLEEGEVNEERIHAAVSYEADKIIDYPGFNMPLPPGVYDEHRKLGWPPMLPHHEKSNMMGNLTLKTPKNANKRKSLDPVRSSGGKRQRRGAEDMDVSDTDSQGEPPSPGSMIILDSVDENTGGFQTPLAVDRHKKRLKSTEMIDSPASPTDAPGTSTPRGVKSTTDSPASPMETPVREHLAMIKTPSSGGSLQMNYGTPLVLDSTLDKSADLSDSIKRGKCLPDSSKFSVGIQEHLNFDNLPNIQGGFAKLRKVIKAVRNQDNP